MEVGPYAPDSAIVGFPFFLDRDSPQEELIGALILVGPPGWYSSSERNQTRVAELVRLMTLSVQVIRSVSRILALADWNLQARSAKMATAGKLHGVLSPLQRVELKLSLLEVRLKQSRPHRELLSALDPMRTEIFEIKRCIKDFLGSRAIAAQALQTAYLPLSDYIDPMLVIGEIKILLNEFAERRKKQIVVRSPDPLAWP